MKKINTKTSKRIAALILAAVAAFSVMGCSVEKTVTKTETHTDANGNTTTTTTTQVTDENGTTTTTETTEGVGDLIEETAYAIFDNDVFSFEYDPEYFVVMEDEEYVTVSFYNEETQTAGSNTIMFKEIENKEAMEVAKEFAKQYGVDESNIYESNFGETGATAYSFTLYPTDEEVSENQTRAMAMAVVNGDNVITIEVLTHVEPDEGMDMFINDKIAEVLDTFKID